MIMKKLLLILILIFTGVSFAGAENQKYVVSNKKEGKARFIPVEKEGENWIWIKDASVVYFENGTEFEGFVIHPDESLNYVRSPYVSRKNLIAEYEGKYYVVPLSDKNVTPIDESGNATAGLGIRNYLSNSKLGDYYRTSNPGMIALGCVIISAIFMFVSLKREKVSMFIRWGFSLPLCIVSVLEIGAAFSLGTDAAWWVNPDDVGYLIATPLLIPYAMVAGLMVFSYKLYGIVGKVNGVANYVVSVLMIIGIVLTVISAIFVVINFLFAAFLLIFAGWVLKGVDHKNYDGSVTHTGPLGSYRTDQYGNTTRLS